MITRLLGQGSMAADLRGGLDESAQAARGIAHRVANGANGGASFSATLQDAGKEPDGSAEVDMEREMVALAEEQIRFEAATGLLQKVYQQIRLGIREV